MQIAIVLGLCGGLSLVIFLLVYHFYVRSKATPLPPRQSLSHHRQAQILREFKEYTLPSSISLASASDNSTPSVSTHSQSPSSYRPRSCKQSMSSCHSSTRGVPHNNRIEIVLPAPLALTPPSSQRSVVDMWAPGPVRSQSLSSHTRTPHRSNSLPPMNSSSYSDTPPPVPRIPSVYMQLPSSTTSVRSPGST
ncbi:hypothetical protein VKT23_005739 [Stygiomarasmius scandens]|uniref:Uncharacterized protein n=1 Tax=Marasmiellus scandens TaxID=2682957 RepID=A0ABR1JMV4_9AGAR